MTKKMLVAALALMATLLLSANSFAAAPCSTSVTVAINVVGSSAQFNSWAYATSATIGTTYHLFSVKGNISNGPPAVPIAGVQDTRTSPVTLDSATVWFMWDNNAACKAYAYFNVDSGIGQRIFFATTSTGTAAGLPYLDSSLNGGGGTGATHSVVGGLADTDAVLPSSVYLAFAGNGTTTTPKPFNAAPTDLRPEDVLFATNRALNALDATKYTGLGYSQAGCGGTATVGCVVYTSFASGKYFNVIKYALGGSADPITGGTVPKTYTTVGIGAAPVVIFVSDTDTATGGFGSVSGGSYVIHDINRQVLTNIFTGQLSRTTDVVSQLPVVPGTGKPIQVVQREVLSGTYNTFEFTGVRTLAGSNNPLVGASATSVINNANTSQEFGNNPTQNFNTANCGTTGSGGTIGNAFPVSGSTCGDPLFRSTGGGGLRVRAIGTGEEVASVLNQTKNQSGSSTNVEDGIGYAFWSYGNFNPTASPKNCVGSACTAYFGHYLTVDGIDPLFNTPGGALDSTVNPNGAFHAPTCNLTPPITPCFNVPFTHIKDGTYPLWSLLRVVVRTPEAAALTTIVKKAQSEVLASPFTSDYVPLTDGNGNLILNVFRSHEKQQGINPNNGHSGCSSFHPITAKSGKTCLVDAGGDVGGSVLTVQADVDWNTDFGSVAGQPIEMYGLHQ
jgi:hypothetical protein